MAELTDNVNLFQQTGFKVLIDRKNYPNLEFFAQSVIHPGITASAAEAPVSRIQSVPQPGDTLTFGELSFTILLDEDFNSYIEMFNWMLRLVNRNNTTPYQAITQDVVPTTSDIIVTGLTSHNNANKKFTYIDAFPTSMGDINFEANNPEYAVFNASFRFSYFEID